MRDTDTQAQIQRWDDLSAQPIDTSVIDPLDTRGQKNRYIAELRDASVLDALDRYRVDGPVLDFGCGTGGLSAAISRSRRPVLGIDISPGLLGRVRERTYPSPVLFIRYGGENLPLRDASVAAVTSYVVLTHIIEDADLSHLLSEIRRVLRPGGVLVAGEQVRRRSVVDLVAWQRHRTIADFAALCRAAGLELLEAQVVRYARFPTTYAVRYGLLPPALHAPLRRLERGVGRWLGPAPWGYSDVCFVLRRAED